MAGDSSELRAVLPASGRARAGQGEQRAPWRAAADVRPRCSRAHRRAALVSPSVAAAPASIERLERAAAGVLLGGGASLQDLLFAERHLRR